MPTAELIAPRRLAIMGKIFSQGVRTKISDEMAAVLNTHPRFNVRGYSRTRAVENSGRVPVAGTRISDISMAGLTIRASKTEPTTKEELYVAIRRAVDTLDPEDEEAFLTNGKPNISALSQALGFTVSKEDRDYAIDHAPPEGDEIDEEVGIDEEEIVADTSGAEEVDTAPAYKPKVKVKKGGVTIKRKEPIGAGRRARAPDEIGGTPGLLDTADERTLRRQARGAPVIDEDGGVAV